MIDERLQHALRDHPCPGKGAPTFHLRMVQHGATERNPLGDFHVHALCERCGAEVCEA